MVGIQTETEAVSFQARGHILNSGSGWISFDVPTHVRSVLGVVSDADLVIVAVSAPAGLSTPVAVNLTRCFRLRTLPNFANA